MTEGTKALNSSVSTLKKNPGRIGRLVKAAKFLLVPPKHYATGAARDTLEAAVRKLKGKRGLNGIVGEGAGPFSDKALQKSAGEQEKKAVDKKTQDRALAASGVASGAALGGVLTHDAKKSRVTSRMATKGTYKHMGNASVGGAEKRLANSAKTLRRMSKPLRRAGIKGAIVGGLTGAALGAAHLKKEAAAKEVGKVVGGGSAGATAGAIAGAAVATKISSGHKKVYEKGGKTGATFLKNHGAQATKRFKKYTRGGGIAGATAGLTAGGVSAYKSLKGKLEKKAGEKGAVAGGVAGGAAAGLATKAVAKRVITKKVKYRAGDTVAKHFLSGMKRGNEGMARGLRSIRKYNAKRDNLVAKASRRMGVIGGAAGALLGSAAGASIKGKTLEKKAGVPAVIPKQQFLGKGTVPAGAKDVSPKAVLKRKARKAGKVAVGVAAAAALAGAAKKHLEKKAAEKKDRSHIGGMAAAGGSAAYIRRQAKDTKTALVGMAKQTAYIHKNGGTIKPMDVRMALDSFRKPIARRSLKSTGKGAAVGALVGAAMDRMGHKKQAAAMIKRDGKKYRKGTVGSATVNMAGLNTGMQLAGNIVSKTTVDRMGIPVAKSSLLRNVPKAAITGAVMGYGYGTIREHLRKKRGEESLNHADFAKKKASK